MDQEALNSMKMSALAEIGNIGAGNATTALSQVLGGKKVDISVTKAQMVPITEVAEALGGPERIVYAVHLHVSGDINGDVLFIMSEEGATTLAGIMTFKGAGFEGPLTELEESALKELGNIVAGSYVSAISQMTNMYIEISPPDLVVDMLGAILDAMLIQIGLLADEVVMLKTQIIIEGEEIDAEFLFLLDEDNMKKLLQKLGLPV